MPLPNLIIAGPPKSGTTSLFEWLSKHPDAYPCIVKEPDYFNDTIPSDLKRKHFTRDGWEGYNQLFNGRKTEKIVFEASPKYIYSELAIEKTNQIDNLKVVFIKRNTADQIYSEYKFHHYKTKLFSGSFEDYLHHKNIDLTNGSLESFSFGYNVQKWIEAFGSEYIRVIDFMSLKEAPRDIMKKLCLYLEIDPQFYNDFQFNVSNETYGVRSRKLHYWLLTITRLIPQKVKELLVPIYFSINKTSVPQKTNEERKIISALSNQFEQLDKTFEQTIAQVILC